MKHRRPRSCTGYGGCKNFVEIIVKIQKPNPFGIVAYDFGRQDCGNLLTKDKVVTHTEWFYTENA